MKLLKPSDVMSLSTTAVVEEIAEDIAEELIGKTLATIQREFMEAHGEEIQPATKELFRLFKIASLVRYYLLGRNPQKWLYGAAKISDPDLELASKLAASGIAKTQEGFARAVTE